MQDTSDPTAEIDTAPECSALVIAATAPPIWTPCPDEPENEGWTLATKRKSRPAGNAQKGKALTGVQK